MARITRKNQKVFAGNANADQIAVFGSMKTGTPVYSSDLDSLQSADYSEGWADAILNDKAPYLEEMNGVQYGLSSQIAYILQQGMAIEYNAATTYYKGSVVAVINNGIVTYYKSIADDNQGYPVTNTSKWQLDSISKIETYYTNLTNAINQCVKLTGAQTVAGNKTFTGTTSLKKTSISDTLTVSGGATFTGTTKVPNSVTAGTALALAERGTNYIKFGDGTILQWGAGTTSDHYIYVNLPVRYSSDSSYRAILSDGGGDTETNVQKVIAYAANRFRVYSDTSANDNFQWFTIGR